jgi:serine/threonine protein kinase
LAQHDGGRTLGSYQLLSQLAVGGMAEIYVARTRGLGGFEKLLALKVIHPNYSSDPDFVQMLVDEAKLSVQLQHANIVQTFDLGRVDEQYYIAMELIDGVDLYKLLRRASEHGIDFPFEVAAFICAELCSGLDYAHKKRDARGRALQIVHRDISPQNVLVGYDGGVKIVDFGIAKAAMRSQQTAAGVIKGKYYYMSPEQAWGDPIDARTDIFSAGILLYEMIIGQMLYLEEEIPKLLEMVRKAAIASPSTKRMSVPRELEAIVMRALRKRADERWPSAAELAQVLSEFVHGFAPDFSRARLAAFVREVMGDDPTAQRRDPRSATAPAAHAGDAPKVRDENSLLFKLHDLKPEDAASRGSAAPSARSKADGAPRAASAPSTRSAPRRADVATNVRPRPDFGESENDATIVDAGNRMLGLPGDVGDPSDPGDPSENDATRPVGPAIKRGTAALPSGKFDLGPEDPAHDPRDPTDAHDKDEHESRTAPARRAMLDEDDIVTGARRLPRPSVALPVLQPAVDVDVADDDPPSPSLPGVRPTRGQAPNRRSPSLQSPPSLPDSFGPFGEDEATSDLGPARPRPQSPSGSRPPSSPRLTSFDEPDQPTVSARSRPSATLSQASSSAAPLPPSPHPLGNPAHASSGSRSALKASFDEPTHIPPAIPPPIDSGRWEPRLSDSQHPPLTAMTAQPYPPSPSLPGEPQLRNSGRGTRLILIIVAVALSLAIAVLAALTLGAGDARATLSIVSLPSGAEVRVDGNAASSLTPLQLVDIDPRQPHHVRVFKAGWDAWESDVKFSAHEREVRVQAVLVPTVGTLQITSTPPGAEAIVNGRVGGTTPTTIGDLPPNDDVVIELRLRGYKVAHRTLAWAGKRALSVSIPLEKAK